MNLKFIQWAYGTQNNKNTTTLIYQLKNAYNGIEDINTSFNQTRL